MAIPWEVSIVKLDTGRNVESNTLVTRVPERGVWVERGLKEKKTMSPQTQETQQTLRKEGILNAGTTKV